MCKVILAINGGSSSLKAAIFESANTLQQMASANVERIGSPNAGLALTFPGQPPQRQPITAATHDAALTAVMNCFRSHFGELSLIGVGHRVVHGGPKFAAAQIVTPALLDELHKLEPFDPEHLPAQIKLIQLLQLQQPAIPHVASFDTAFHHNLPPVARRLPIPRKFDAIGVRRYGFHGLSFTYLMQELRRIDAVAANGRVVLAHLGNGASLAAVRNGHCLDTSMALTPAAGITMGTRSGDLDPGLLDYLMRMAGLTVEQFNRMVHLESGLLGISETTADMQQLLKCAATDHRAAEAVDIFCYQVQKWIGAYAAVLGGMDLLVFSGGIGEHAAEIRERICRELEFLGIAIDAEKNLANAPLISSGTHPVKIRVIATNEEQIIAQELLTTISTR